MWFSFCLLFFKFPVVVRCVFVSLLVGWFCVLKEAKVSGLSGSLVGFDQQGATRNFPRDLLIVLDASYYPKTLIRMHLGQDTCVQRMLTAVLNFCPFTV